MYKEFKLVRVDHRLIHAQIILIWLKHLNINHIIIVDNEVAGNPFLSQVYKLTIPPSLHIEIFSQQNMIDYCAQLSDTSAEVKRTLVIMKTLQTAVVLSSKGVRFDNIQISETAEGANKKNQFLLYLQKKYASELQILEHHQILVYHQRVPEDTKDALNHIEKNNRKKANVYNTQ